MLNNLLGKNQKTERSEPRPLLPVALDLGSTKFEFEESECKWKSLSKNAQEDEKHIGKLQYEVDRLRERIEVLEKEKLKELETRYMIEFKNTLIFSQMI